jgi:hypothetical protein
MSADLDYCTYALVATARGHEVLYFEEFGSYQGSWAMLSYRDDGQGHLNGDGEGRYFLWVDYYGTCSGCDSLLDHDPSTPEQALSFAKGYNPFLVADGTLMAHYAAQGVDAMMRVLPRNLRGFGGAYAEVAGKLAEHVVEAVKTRSPREVYCKTHGNYPPPGVAL